MDNGGKRAFIPIENKRRFLEVDAEHDLVVSSRAAPKYGLKPGILHVRGLAAL